MNAAGTTVRAAFYAVHGQDDRAPVDLGALGWAEMVENVVRIDVECLDDRPQAGEAQVGKGKMPA